jgi:hypothetical protein
MRPGALLIMMSPVAESVTVPTSVADSSTGSRDDEEAGGAGVEPVGSAQDAAGLSESRFAKATLPTPIAARTARTIATVRTGRPKIPGRGCEGWEFIDGDDTFRWPRGRTVERLVVDHTGRRKILPVTVGMVTLRYLDQGVPARFLPACA